MKTIVRFIGDPIGYTLDPADVPPEGSIPSGWVTARIGVTGQRVRIDLAKAYVIEHKEDPWRPMLVDVDPTLMEHFESRPGR